MSRSFVGGDFLKVCSYFGYTKKKGNAETADYSQNTQTGWECGDDANFVVYATIPARLFMYLKYLKTQTDIVS